MGWIKEDMDALALEFEDQWQEELDKAVERRLSELFGARQYSEDGYTVLSGVARSIYDEGGDHALGRWALGILRQAVERGSLEGVEVLTHHGEEEVDSGGEPRWGNENAVSSEVFLSDGSIIRFSLKPPV